MNNPNGDSRYGRPQQHYAGVHPGQNPQHYPGAAAGSGQAGYGGPVPMAPAMPGHVPGFGALPSFARGYAAGPGGAIAAPSGLPASLTFVLAIVAVVVALGFDVLFLHVSIPGVGGYAWYLTTALSFAGAGYAGAKWTRASQGTAYAAVVLAGVLYGLADVGLGLVLEDLPMTNALFLGIQGLVIAAVCGGGGVRRGMAAKDD